MASIYSRINELLRFSRRQPTGSSQQISPQTRKLLGITAEDLNDPNLRSVLQSLQTNANNSREGYLADFKLLENFYLIEAIVTAVIDDALAPDITSGEILEVVCDDPEINDALAEFQQRVDLDNVITEILPDLLMYYGEYYLRPIIRPGEGVVDIVDNVDPRTHIALYRNGYPIQFLRYDTTSSSRDVKFLEPHQLAHFILGTRKLKVELGQFSDHYQQLLQARGGNPDTDPSIILPSHARIGRPIFYGVLDKLKELALLEKLVPGTKINQAARGSVVGIEVPPGTPPEDAFKIAREYEQLFNLKTGVNEQTGQMSATDIISIAGRVKVIPQYSNKGSMSSIDVVPDANMNELMSTVHDCRDVITSAIGFPSGLLYGGETHGDALRQNIRYARRIKSIQTAIGNGVIQLCLTHLCNLKEGYNKVTMKDLRVKFKNESINLSELEKLEYFDATSGYVKNVIEMYADTKDKLGIEIMPADSLMSWVRNKIEFITYQAGDDEPDSKETPDNVSVTKTFARFNKTGKVITAQDRDAEAERVAASSDTTSDQGSDVDSSGFMES